MKMDILSLLEVEGPLTSADISIVLGRPQNEVRQTLVQKLLPSGKVSVSELDRKWYVTSHNDEKEVDCGDTFFENVVIIDMSGSIKNFFVKRLIENQPMGYCIVLVGPQNKLSPFRTYPNIIRIISSDVPLTMMSLACQENFKTVTVISNNKSIHKNFESTLSTFHTKKSITVMKAT
jgi:hypothetical protein